MQKTASQTFRTMPNRRRKLPGQPVQIGLLKNDGPFFKPAIVGHEIVPIDYPTRHFHDFASDAVERMGLVMVSLSGEAIVSTAQGRERLDRGAVMLASLPCRAEIILSRSARPWEFAYVLVRDAWPMKAFDWLRERHGSFLHLPPAARSTAAFFRECRELVSYARGPGGADLHELSTRTFTWFMKLLACAHKSDDVRARTPGRMDIEPAEVPTGCHTIKELARRLRYSPSHLSRKLARTWKKAPGRALRLSRLEEASNLLRNTDLSVGEVAARAGYLSTSSFVRAFRTAFGRPPGDWRHQPSESIPELVRVCAPASTTTSKAKRSRRARV